MTTLEAVLAATSVVLGGGGAFAGVVAWRGRRQLREIDRAEKADEHAAKREERENTAQHRALDLLAGRVQTLEGQKDECLGRIDAIRLEEQQARHKLRADLVAQFDAIDEELDECRRGRAVQAALSAAQAKEIKSLRASIAPGNRRG